ncbi:MAG: hypothetical protein ACW98Y_11320 [Candidatus Thorarchaeota archaeon]|jgi:hypothetical protein
MVTKRFGDMMRPNIKKDAMTFNEVAQGLTASFDERLLRDNLPPVSGVRTSDSSLASNLGKYIPKDTVEALKDTEFVNVYGRVVTDRRSGQMCLQYLFVWDYQAVPAHEADYEPVFIYLEGNSRYAVYDLVHYCTRRLDLHAPREEGPGLRVVPGWHSFLPVSNLKSSEIDSDLDIEPLSDQHLDSWWNIPDEEARLKIENHLLDPFSLDAPGHFLDEPDEDSQTMCCIFKEIEGALVEYPSPRDGLIEGLKRSFTRCVGLLQLYRLATFIKLLIEMNDIGMINIPPSIRDGLNLGTISQILQDGFIKITKKGSSLFQGFGEASEHQDEYE